MKRLTLASTIALLGLLLLLGFTACTKTQATEPGPQPLPVNTQAIDLKPVPRADEFVATVKSRRSASIQPQVDGAITQILVRSGDHVRAGQVLVMIDPLKQQATVDQQRSTEAQKKATLDYTQNDVERLRRLYESGVSSKRDYELALQAYQNSKADFESSTAARITQQRQLSYYSLRAPFAGVVGDIPVHVGDYVSPQTLLTTVDENADLEAYVYVPTERSGDIRMGLPIEIVNTKGELIEGTKINFISEQVDNSLQGVLVKAPLHTSIDKFRNAQLVKARVIWSTKPAPTVPVLAVSHIGGQSFVYIVSQGQSGTVAKQRAVSLGDTIGNDYTVIGGLNPGEKVITTGIQFLIDGAPIKPIS
jgi:RND family efflux transporter MFP subunit